MKFKLPIASVLLAGVWLLPVAGYTADTSKSAVSPSVNETASSPVPRSSHDSSSLRSDHPIDDSVITTKIKAKFIKDKQVRTDNIEINTVNGAVELFGTAGSRAKAAHAVALARQVKGVKSVKNDIEITPPKTAARSESSADGNRTADKRRSDQPIDDTWITTKVKARFAQNKQVSFTDIHVKTLNGVVELTGNANSRDESTKAASLARGVKHVKSVTNNISVN